jgi:hypothetical protein
MWPLSVDLTAKIARAEARPIRTRAHPSLVLWGGTADSGGRGSSAPAKAIFVDWGKSRAYGGGRTHARGYVMNLEKLAKLPCGTSEPGHCLPPGTIAGWVG